MRDFLKLLHRSKHDLFHRQFVQDPIFLGDTRIGFNNIYSSTSRMLDFFFTVLREWLASYPRTSLMLDHIESGKCTLIISFCSQEHQVSISMTFFSIIILSVRAWILFFDFLPIMQHS
jgi:hypothetical protein